MTKEKEELYKKAHVELYEVIKKLPKEEKEKIPEVFLNNLKNDMDDKYIFKYDDSKTLIEQNLMDETKALLVQMYIKYMAQEKDTELWKKYNRICSNEIEEKKRAKFNPDNLFKEQIKKEKNNIEKVQLTEIKEAKWYKKIFNKIVEIIKRKK